MAHPEALLNSKLGQRLLDDPVFCSNVVALVIDECHTVDLWGPNFRKEFGKLHVLRAHFQCPMVALSATIQKSNWVNVAAKLGMTAPVHIFQCPENQNMKLVKLRKPPSRDACMCSESVYLKELHKLKELGPKYPVTLCYMPLQWCADAQAAAISILGAPDLHSSPYAIYFATQAKSIQEYVVTQLQKEEPQLRLVFCTSAIGMGFDSPSVTNIIHAKPPRSAIDFLQQIGRAGRKGQPALSILYFNGNDLARNTGIEEDMRAYCTTQQCMRKCLLTAFGFETSQARGCNCCSNCAADCACGACATI